MRESHSNSALNYIVWPKKTEICQIIHFKADFTTSEKQISNLVSYENQSIHCSQSKQSISQEHVPSSVKKNDFT